MNEPLKTPREWLAEDRGCPGIDGWGVRDITPEDIEDRDRSVRRQALLDVLIAMVGLFPGAASRVRSLLAKLDEEGSKGGVASKSSS